VAVRRIDSTAIATAPVMLNRERHKEVCQTLQFELSNELMLKNQRYESDSIPSPRKGWIDKTSFSRESVPNVNSPLNTPWVLNTPQNEHFARHHLSQTTLAFPVHFQYPHHPLFVREAHLPLP
jgi:hypothetical protein